jgi:hypothetical protein
MFDPRQKTPWPLWRRVQLAAGVTFVAPTLQMTLREWVFDPWLSLTLPGQPVTHLRQNIPSGGKGAFWALPERDPKQPIMAAFVWLQLAIRLFGFDIGFEVWYRCKGAHNQ